MNWNTQVLLYWIWEESIVHGSQFQGCIYSRPPNRLISVDRGTKYNDFLRRLYQVIRISDSQYSLKLFCRYPINVHENKTKHTHVGVEDDETLREILQIPSNFPSVCTVQLFILIKSIQILVRRPIAPPTMEFWAQCWATMYYEMEKLMQNDDLDDHPAAKFVIRKARNLFAHALNVGGQGHRIRIRAIEGQASNFQTTEGVTKKRRFGAVQEGGPFPSMSST